MKGWLQDMLHECALLLARKGSECDDRGQPGAVPRHVKREAGEVKGEGDG